MAVVFAVGAVTALFTAIMYGLSGTVRFVPNACSNVASFLPANIVGQDLALRQLVDAVCEHVEAARGAVPASGGALPGHRPLVISVHGPPGVGKTYTHTLLARALYNKDPAKATSCPGEHCLGAKVLYGLSFVEAERATQLDAVRAAIVEHVQSVPDPIIVIEEYDKLDCETRALMRQLLAHPEAVNANLGKAIVLLESNLGFTELEQMLSEAKDRSKITPEAADTRLRGVVFDAWRRAECESYEDTLAFSAAIDFFLPYLPLQREQMVQLLELSLKRYSERLADAPYVRQQALAAAAMGRGSACPSLLTWGPEVTEWLLGKVDFAGGAYPLEGAKAVSTVCVRHVSRIVRSITTEVEAASRSGAKLDGPPCYRLAVAASKAELTASRTKNRSTAAVRTV